jgi:hypothetical protein
VSRATGEVLKGIAHIRGPGGTRVALVLAACAALLLPAAAEAKKKGGKVATASAAGIPIVHGSGVLPNVTTGITRVPLEIGRKFRGEVAGKVEVTTQITGDSDDYLFNFVFGGGARLISPQGRAVQLGVPVDFTGGYNNRSYGPLTLTPDSPVQICGFPPCLVSQPLNAPWAGVGGLARLSRFYGVRMRGTWVYELSHVPVAPGTGVLDQVVLEVTAAKRIKGGEEKK